MSKQVNATARVRLTLEVTLDQPWDGDCSVKQVHEQAKRDAIDKLRTLVEGLRVVRIVGEAEVAAIIVEQTR